MVSLKGIHCKLTKSDGFFLYGVVKDEDEYGVLFKTKQMTSFINWSNIKQLTPQTSVM